jgi:hypothetical protein
MRRLLGGISVLFAISGAGGADGRNLMPKQVIKNKAGAHFCAPALLGDPYGKSTAE